MRKILFSVLLIGGISNASLATDSATQQTNPDANKMTTKDAKKSCKEEGKTGADLVKCMKEKKNEK